MKKKADTRDYVEAIGGGGVLGALLGGGLGAITTDEEKGESMLANTLQGAGTGAVGGALAGALAADGYSNLKRDIRNAGGLAAYFRDRPKFATIHDEHAARDQQKKLGGKIVNTIPKVEYRKIYGEALDEELDKAEQYAEETGVPVHMAKRIKENRIVKTLLTPNPHKNMWQPYQDDKTGEQKGSVMVLSPESKGGISPEQFNDPERMASLKVSGLTLRDDKIPLGMKGPFTGQRNLDYLKGVKYHELAHAMTLKGADGAALEAFGEALFNNPNTMGSIAQQVQATLGTDIDLDHRGEGLGKVIGTAGIWPTYPETDSAEIIPPLSALQHYWWDKHDKRMTTKEEYRNFVNVNDTDIKDDSKFERNIERFPDEVQRLLRYRRTMRKGEGKPKGVPNRRAILFDIINMIMLPAIVKDEKPAISGRMEKVASQAPAHSVRSAGTPLEDNAMKDQTDTHPLAGVYTDTKEENDMHLKNALHRKQANIVTDTLGGITRLPGKLVANQLQPALDRAELTAANTVQDAVNRVRQGIKDERGAIKGDISRAAKHTLAGGLAGGSLGAIVTWLAMKNPTWRDYVAGTGTGAMLGGAGGAAMGLRNLGNA